MLVAIGSWRLVLPVLRPVLRAKKLEVLSVFGLFLFVGSFAGLEVV